MDFQKSEPSWSNEKNSVLAQRGTYIAPWTTKEEWKLWLEYVPNMSSEFSLLFGIDV